jgi:hypothetical protein
MTSLEIYPKKEKKKDFLGEKCSFNIYEVISDLLTLSDAHKMVKK